MATAMKEYQPVLYWGKGLSNAAWDSMPTVESTTPRGALTLATELAFEHLDDAEVDGCRDDGSGEGRDGCKEGTYTIALYEVDSELPCAFRVIEYVCLDEDYHGECDIPSPRDLWGR